MVINAPDVHSVQVKVTGLRQICHTLVASALQGYPGMVEKISRKGGENATGHLQMAREL
jgi:hypothetical protein